MKRCLLGLVLMTFFLGACGTNSDPIVGKDILNAMEDTSLIAETMIGIANDPIEVGEPTQLYLSVTMTSGEGFSGLTTTFDDPNDGQIYPITWSLESQKSAFIDAGARLIPVSEGYATIKAELKGRTTSRTVRIGNVLPLAVETTAPDEDEETDDTSESDTSEDLPSDIIPCQGHAFAVSSFMPGGGAGFGASSMPGVVLGPPQGRGDAAGSPHVVSLGWHGEIILDLGDCHLVDGPGVDLIVFENAFFIGGDPLDPYAELGVVGVSEDGVDFTEFECLFEGYPYEGCAGVNPVYSSVTNDISPFDVESAGGDHFDLSDIGVRSAAYVRIRDLNGSGFGTSIGFDLDAIAVVNGMEAE